MKEIIIETLVDSMKLIPFLFVAFFIIEIIEHKLNNKKIISKAGKIGPLVGGILGLLPQCGFSVIATNLYVTRIISLGTLISIYLTTSDEMLPILLSSNIELSIIIKILTIKLGIGIFYGFMIDLLLRKNKKNITENYSICEEEHCSCNKNSILISSIIHTLKTINFIIIISFVLNLLMNKVNEDTLSKIFLSNSIFSPFVSSIIGLIPNCGSSIILTELYLNGVIKLSSLISGLLTGSGVAILVLFKSNKNIKENLKILSLVYIIGILSGTILELFEVLL